MYYALGFQENLVTMFISFYHLKEETVRCLDVLGNAVTDDKEAATKL